MEEQGTRRRAARGGEQVRSSRMAATHGARGMRWGISANSWRATEWTWWEAGLGRLGCELDFGPKTKFEARELLFIFHLETKVIRALQQRVIKPQNDSVNMLITVTGTRLQRSKLGQTQCNFLHALLHNITFNFYFWTNSSCLTNFGERGMPTSLLSEIPDLEYF